MRKESASSLEDFVRCPRKYYFGRVLKVATERSEAQSFGSIIDEALEAYYMSNDEDAALQVINRAIPFMKEKEADLALHMIPDYFIWAKKNPFPTGEVKIQRDYPSLAFVDKGVLLHGKPDMVIEQEDKIFIIDHKTASYPWSYDDTLMNLQGEIYSFIVGNVEKKKVIMVFNVLYKKYASSPNVNKDGKVSRQKITTTREKYLEKILELGQDPNDYSDILVTIGTEVFFERLSVEFDRKGGQFLIESILNAINQQKNRLPYRSVGPLCKSSCSFYPTCVAAGNREEAVLHYVRSNGLTKEEI